MNKFRTIILFVCAGGGLYQIVSNIPHLPTPYTTWLIIWVVSVLAEMAISERCIDSYAFIDSLVDTLCAIGARWSLTTLFPTIPLNGGRDIVFMLVVAGIVAASFSSAPSEPEGEE